MARVTKINVGGTNYDIAHEGELKNSGFEVVTELPTTGLFAGRQVFYNGQEYIYNGVVWCNQLNPLQKLYIPFEVNLYTLDQLNSMSQVIQLSNFQISQIPELLAGRQWTSVFSQILRKSEFDCEIKRGDADWVNYDWLFWDYQYRSFSEGTEIRITTHNLAKFANNSLTQAFFMNCNQSNNVVELTIEYLNYKNLSGDNDINNEANYEWHTIFKKELKTLTSWVFPAQVYVKTGKEEVYARDIRLTLRVVSGYLYANGLDFYLQTEKGQTVGTTPFLINYNSTIEPTQTGEVFKANKWILQYLTQGVNWLRANDNTKLDKRAYNQIYTNCGYVNVPISSQQGALIIELPFAPNSSDANNSMTYIELNVYSHKKGCSKYIIGVYSYSQNSTYEWSVYSYMGYNYFSKISFGRRTDNNNIVVVLGDFTDVHLYEHFSISNIITGYNRNNDDTDGFLLYTDSDSNNYNALISSTYISPIISYNDLTDTPNLATVATSGSYNDLTDTPNLATVATSGSYNDLTDKPTFSGSYNDLTDKPTLFSGSYDDLTDKPTLATVATSGSYNDLTDKPTFSGSYNDLTDKPNLATVATSGSYNDLTDKPTLFSGSYDDLTDKPTLFSGNYDDLTNKPTLATVATSGSYNDLTDKPNLATVATSGDYDDLLNKPALVFSNIGGTISSVQIPDGLIANAKLANSSMTLNGTNCELGDTKTLPCIISFDGTLYKVRIYQNWLQIYHAGMWVNKYYLSSNPPTECVQISDLSDPSWYDESVTEYELDNSATTQLLLANSSTNIANWLEAIEANQITFNSSVIASKDFNKGALDNIISNLKGNGYSVFVENDLDTIIGSGSDYLVRIKISKVPTAKAIIECYVAR